MNAKMALPLRNLEKRLLEPTLNGTGRDGRRGLSDLRVNRKADALIEACCTLGQAGKRALRHRRSTARGSRREFKQPMLPTKKSRHLHR